MPAVAALALLSVLVPVALRRTPGGPAAAAVTRAACGVERWDVKTLADPAAGAVSFRPRLTTVRALTRLRIQPFSLSRDRGVERTTYLIHVRVIEAHKEADQDYHLIVTDPHTAGPTMIVEFPDPGCTAGAAPEARRMMRRARTLSS